MLPEIFIATAGQAGCLGRLLVKSINKGKHFLVLEDQVKKNHIEYTSKSLENKILSEILFFYKVLTIFMNFIQNNLLNQIKMSKKFVWNLKVLTAGLSIIKMSILLVLPFSSPEKIL